MSTEARALWADGDFVDARTPLISPFDVAWRSGHGAFESFSVRLGDRAEVHALFDAHRERLGAAARFLALGDVPPFDGPSIFRELLERANLSRGRARISLHAKGSVPRFVALVERGEDLDVRRARGVRLVTSPFRFGDEDPTPQHKCEARGLYAVALADAVRRGADDALLIGRGGSLLETTRASVFVVRTDGAVVTPPVHGRALPGITRGVLVRDAARFGLRVSVAPIDRAELRSARQVFLANAVVGIEAVRSVDGESLPSADDSLEARKVLDQCLHTLRSAGMGI
ncbi:MAG: aminotransferase class IV [Planctomycetes bacterium]|nr:aminotransferase class IV [Planctomycetota bacterium]MCB9918846.1 aminotransferase class IV [Planctomycetota bacterium]